MRQMKTKQLMGYPAVVLLLLLLSCAVIEPAQTELVAPSEDIDPETAELLEKINVASAYEVPDLGLRKDQNYAKTAQDVEPFGHVKPYKQHFLEQMEYKDKVWAILGTIDGANSHIAIRVALKAEVVMMNSGDMDPTLLRAVACARPPARRKEYSSAVLTSSR